MNPIAIIPACACLLGCSPSSDHEGVPASRDEVLAASDVAPAAAADVESVVSGLVGTHHHAGGQAEQAALERAVDDVVAEMNVIARGIARRKLLETNAIPGSVRIEGDPNQLTVAFDERVYTASVGGPEVEVVGITGDKLKMTLRVRGNALVQRFAGAKGSKTNTMKIDGGRLRVHVTVQSDSLPKPLVYRLTYTKSG